MTSHFSISWHVWFSLILCLFLFWLYLWKFSEIWILDRFIIGECEPYFPVFFAPFTVSCMFVCVFYSLSPKSHFPNEKIRQIWVLGNNSLDVFLSAFRPYPLSWLLPLLLMKSFKLIFLACKKSVNVIHYRKPVHFTTIPYKPKQPRMYKWSYLYIFAILVPVLMTLCMLGFKLLELFCMFLWVLVKFLCVKNYVECNSGHLFFFLLKIVDQ